MGKLLGEKKVLSETGINSDLTLVICGLDPIKGNGGIIIHG